MTLDVGGAAMVWDPLAGGSMRVLRSFQLRADCREECTCLLLHHNMLVVGARDCMTIYDPRRKAAVASTPLARIGYDRSFTAHNNIAARSLALNGCLLSVGLSSGGGVLFFDKRKMGTCVAPPGERSTAARGKYARAMHACTSHPVETAVPSMLETSLRRDALCAGASASSWVARRSLHWRACHTSSRPRARAGLPIEAPAGAGGGDAGVRYSLRKRSAMRVPARYAAADKIPGLTQPQEAYDEVSTMHDLTPLLKPCAVFRQPAGEVHYDEVAEFGFGNAVDNAVFSHAWAPDGRAVFACGGPLAMGCAHRVLCGLCLPSCDVVGVLPKRGHVCRVRGCYMSLWT